MISRITNKQALGINQQIPSRLQLPSLKKINKYTNMASPPRHLKSLHIQTSSSWAARIITYVAFTIYSSFANHA
uniref:Uncharacterized protein n=1 Tax=Anguilla anguilla TaxID=7936 RepID=A0A0E9RIT6_ANGAN